LTASLLAGAPFDSLDDARTRFTAAVVVCKCLFNGRLGRTLGLGMEFKRFNVRASARLDAAAEASQISTVSQFKNEPRQTLFACLQGLRSSPVKSNFFAKPRICWG
jgi:hypothetical protein